MNSKVTRKFIFSFFLLSNFISSGKTASFTEFKEKNNFNNHKIIWSKIKQKNIENNQFNSFDQIQKEKKFSNKKITFTNINTQNSVNVSNGDYYFESFLSKSDIDKKNLKNFKGNSLDKEDSELFLANLSFKEDELVIQSETQSDKDNILYADGNVLVSFNGKFLKGESLTYDKANKLLSSKGDISLIIGKQIFKMTKFDYDFKNEKGYLYEIKGLLNLETLFQDLSVKINDSDVGKILDSLKIKKDAVTHTPNQVKNWIFYTNKMSIDGDKWTCDKVVFTNDLLELRQFKIVVNDLEAVSKKEELKFKSSLNYLIFDEKISIPFWFGNRTLDKDGTDLDNVWNISYDKLDKDGLFIGRSFNFRNLLNNFTLNLEPQFLIQRSFKGSTKSFVNPGESVSVPEKIKQDTKFTDYFGIDSKIKGKIKDWNLIFDTKINSFDIEKFSNAIRMQTILNKEISFLDNNWDLSFFNVYRDRVWNGSLGEAEIYNGYGAKLEKQNFWEVDGILKSEILSFGISNIRAEAFKNKNLTKSLKGNLFYSLDQNFPINVEQKGDNIVDKSFEYISEPIRKGLTLNTKVELLYSLYDGGKNQSYVGFGAGPELTFGNFQNKFFDYSRITFMPFYKLNSGESKFKYDQISENFTLDIAFDQQLYGPLIIKSNATLNLDSNSDDYGYFINSKISLNWKKRSYEFGIFYQPHDEAGGILFNLFGFK